MIWAIQSQSKLFYDLEEAMQACDYVPRIAAWSFETDSNRFTFDDLAKINNEPWADGKIRPLSGELELDDFRAAVDTINTYLSYIRAEETPHSSEEISIAKSRVISFWEIVKKFVLTDARITKAYQHFPDKGTRFHMGILWDCVYIFIADNKGFLVAMGAYD